MFSPEDILSRLQSRITRRSKAIASFEKDYSQHKVRAGVFLFYEPERAQAHKQAAKAIRDVIRPLVKEQIIDKQLVRYVRDTENYLVTLEDALQRMPL